MYIEITIRTELIQFFFFFHFCNVCTHKNNYLIIICTYSGTPGEGTVTSFLFPLQRYFLCIGILFPHFFLQYVFYSLISENIPRETLYLLNVIFLQASLLYRFIYVYIYFYWYFRAKLFTIVLHLKKNRGTKTVLSLKLYLFYFYFIIQVSRILYSFSTAFRRSSRPADISHTALSSRSDSDLYTFTVTLEVKEDDGKGNYRYLVHTRTHTHTRSDLVYSSLKSP